MSDQCMLGFVCSKCKVYKPLDDFLKRGWCKSCRRSYSQSWYLKNKNYVIGKVRKWAADNPYKRAEILRRYSAKNRDIERKRKAVWVTENPEKRKESTAKWRNANQEKRKKYNQKWITLNRGRSVENCASRRARKIKATPFWSETSAIKNLYKEAHEISKTFGPVHVDHIVPLKSKIVCGLHVLANLRIIGAKENISKNNRTWPDMPD